MNGTVHALLEQLYPHRGDELSGRIDALAARYAGRLGSRRVPPPSQRTSYLISYGDSVRRPGQAPLATLADTLDRHVGATISDVHLLPMFPWTSDDGFGVVDYRRINPSLGDWPDVERLGRRYDLMFDFVANHVSASSEWFTGWLRGDPRRAGYFIEPEQVPDTSHVVRPRTSPLFHSWPGERGPRSAWTTFGSDQVDVNVANPEVLVELTDVLLGYLERGASSVRLDAIGFLWKSSGTRCLHLPQTHAVIRLWRRLVDELAPGARLITETNVPHAENITYFGDGTDEAAMVYQFALPPLVLHSFVSGSSEALSGWASGIGPVSSTATWLNFLASHDGIGMRPSEGLLSTAQRDALVQRTREVGGRVSLADGPDGSSRVYELNVSFLDALARADELTDDAVVVAKALAAHHILLSVVGVPAIYLHSLFGSASDVAGMRASGINRRVNRAVLDADTLDAELGSSPRRRPILRGLLRLLELRATREEFSPFAAQRVERLVPQVFAVRRGAGEGLLCVTNLVPERVDLPRVSGRDLITGEQHRRLILEPYGHVWLEGCPAS